MRETAKGRLVPPGLVPPGLGEGIYAVRRKAGAATARVRHEIAEGTVFVFLDEHLPLAAALEAEYPDAVEIGEGVE